MRVEDIRGYSQICGVFWQPESFQPCLSSALLALQAVALP